MTTLDFLYLALIIVLLFVDHFVLWPTFLRRAKTSAGRARVELWLGYMIMLWTMVFAGIALWQSEARTWEFLRMISPHGWQMWVATVLVLALIYTQARPVLRIVRSRSPLRVKMGNPHVERLAPHTGVELGWWVGVSLTAGFCEEFVFRGYLIWVFQPLLGLWGAAALSVVAFGLAHTYQGAKGILITSVIGAILTLVVVILGSLLPAMALHAIADVGQGLVAWLALRQSQGEGTTVAEGEET